jgi:ribosomal protein S18 acetylase RimI-like enzyme
MKLNQNDLLNSSSLNLVFTDVLKSEFEDLVEFDRRFYLEDNWFLAADLPPALTINELVAAQEQGSIMRWAINQSQERAGYFWVQPKPNALFIEGLAVAKPCRRQNVGRRILEHIDALGKGLSYARCELAVIPKNEAALGLYFSNGFYVVGHIEQHGDKFRILMAKDENMSSPIESQREFAHCADSESLKKLIDAGYLGSGLVDGKISFVKARP